VNDDPLLAAVMRSIDVVKLRREIAEAAPRAPAAPVQSAPAVAPASVGAEVLRRIVLADLLDDSILGARQGDESFPLRLFLGQLGDSLGDDGAFALAAGLNFYFRAPMDEEWKMRLGIEVSQAYYRFVAEGKLDASLARKVSPLLSALLNTEVTRVRFESVDHHAVFESAQHERDEGSNPASATIRRPVSLLCRVASNNVVRVKARVRT
jgi:hypothetical protein